MKHVNIAFRGLTPTAKRLSRCAAGWESSYMPTKSSLGTVMGVDEDILREVQANGWQLISISDTDPPFVYSIGLMPEHPEVIVFGLEVEVAAPILNVIAKRAKLGERFDKGIYDIDANPGRIGIRRVHATQIPLHFGYAMGYCRLLECGDVQAVQVFWPDNLGKFPFDAGCHCDVYQRQPRLDIGLTAKEVAAWERLWE